LVNTFFGFEPFFFFIKFTESTHIKVCRVVGHVANIKQLNTLRVPYSAVR
jgi:hypothetical protein